MPEIAKELSPFYPKWIDTPDKRRIIVQDAEEEALEMSAPAPEPEAPKPDMAAMNMLAAGGITGHAEGAGYISSPTVTIACPEGAAAPLNLSASDNRGALRAEAEGLGIKVDGRWSADRLREEIKKASDPK